MATPFRGCRPDGTSSGTDPALTSPVFPPKLTGGYFPITAVPDGTEPRFRADTLLENSNILSKNGTSPSCLAEQPAPIAELNGNQPSHQDRQK